MGTATSMAGEHEDGGGLAPDFQLFQSVELLLFIQSRHRHDQSRGAAGEFSGLGVVGNRKILTGRLVIQNPALKTQGSSVVFVVVPIAAKLAIAQAPIQINGTCIILTYFQTHDDASGST